MCAHEFACTNMTASACVRALRVCVHAQCVHLRVRAAACVCDYEFFIRERAYA